MLWLYWITNEKIVCVLSLSGGEDHLSLCSTNFDTFRKNNNVHKSDANFMHLDESPTWCILVFVMPYKPVSRRILKLHLSAAVFIFYWIHVSQSHCPKNMLKFIHNLWKFDLIFLFYASYFSCLISIIKKKCE